MRQSDPSSGAFNESRGRNLGPKISNKEAEGEAEVEGGSWTLNPAIWNSPVASYCQNFTSTDVIPLSYSYYVGRCLGES